MKDNPRIMIICWKWADFAACKVDCILLSSKHLHKNLSKYKNEYFDEYKVGYATPAGEATDIITQDLVIRINIENDCGETLEVIGGLVEMYRKENAEVMVFLHRNDSFTQKEVEWVLDHTTASKCFLFGEGRDFIYYPISKKGLLGDNARFYYQMPTEKEPEMKTADTARKVIFKFYFDSVWLHYDAEFFTRIFELKEDLLAHFYSIYADHIAFGQKPWLAHLQGQELLLLRLQSFISDDELSMTKAEQDELTKHEKRLHKSYKFDDCKENLERDDKAAAAIAYMDVSKLLHRIFFREDDDNPDQGNAGDRLRDVQTAFQRLLDALGVPVS
jgi:hypothetical protein